jgi:hypothetical protein
MFLMTRHRRWGSGMSMKSSCSSSSRAKISSAISWIICRCLSNENAKVLPNRIAVTREMAARYCVSNVSSCTQPPTSRAVLLSVRERPATAVAANGDLCRGTHASVMAHPSPQSSACVLASLLGCQHHPGGGGDGLWAAGECAGTPLHAECKVLRGRTCSTRASTASAEKMKFTTSLAYGHSRYAAAPLAKAVPSITTVDSK